MTPSSPSGAFPGGNWWNAAVATRVTCARGTPSHTAQRSCAAHIPGIGMGTIQDDLGEERPPQAPRQDPDCGKFHNRCWRPVVPLASRCINLLGYTWCGIEHGETASMHLHATCRPHTLRACHCARQQGNKKGYRIAVPAVFSIAPTCPGDPDLWQQNLLGLASTRVGAALPICVLCLRLISWDSGSGAELSLHRSSAGLP